MNNNSYEDMIDRIEKELGIGFKGTRRRLKKKSTEFANDNLNSFVTSFNTDSLRLNRRTVGTNKEKNSFDRRSRFNYADFID